MAVMKFFVTLTDFFGGNDEVRGGDIYSRRVGRVREVGVDEVADLPEEGVVSHGIW